MSERIPMRMKALVALAAIILAGALVYANFIGEGPATSYLFYLFK